MTVAGDELRAFIQRIERLEEEKQTLGEDIKSVYQEAKAAGFDTKAMRALVRMRKQDVAEREEAQNILDTYVHAMGMALEQPLFAAVGAMAVDKAAREEVIKAFKLLVPLSGEVIIKMGGAPVRLYRDEEGEAHAEDVVESEPAVRPGKKIRKKATVLTLVPPGAPSAEEIKRIADDAERRSDDAKKKGRKKRADNPEEPAPV